MPKPRKDWKALNIKIQSEVYEELEKYDYIKIVGV